jgi:hypothetical protein
MGIYQRSNRLGKDTSPYQRFMGRMGEQRRVDADGLRGFSDGFFLKLEPSMSRQLVMAFLHSNLEKGDDALMDQHSLAYQRSSQAGHGVKMMGGGYPHQPVDSANEPDGILIHSYGTSGLPEFPDCLEGETSETPIHEQ